MAARALWKGTIRFGTVKVPVKLYSAVQDKSVHLHLLDKHQRKRIHEKLVNPKTGKPVDFADTERAYDTGQGSLVILDKEELDKTEPAASRDIRVEAFLPTGKITHQWYERAYYLGPDGGSKASYFNLAAALGKQDKDGLARWVMRNKEYVGALKPEGDYLMLIELRHAYEVIPVDALPAPGGRPLQKREVDIAKQLIDVLKADFDITQYHDEYRERLMELIDAKAKGKVIRFPKSPRRAAPKSLASALERSLAAARKERASA